MPAADLNIVESNIVESNIVEVESQQPAWRVWLLRLVKALEWAGFVYGVPGMLLVVLLVAMWTVPAVLITAGLLALQAPIWLAIRWLLRRRGKSTDPALAANYQSFHDWLPPSNDPPMAGPSLDSWTRLDRAQRRR